MCVYIYIYTYTYIHICKYMYIYTYTHWWIYVYIYIYIYICTYMCMCIYVYTHKYICMSLFPPRCLSKVFGTNSREKMAHREEKGAAAECWVVHSWMHVLQCVAVLHPYGNRYHNVLQCVAVCCGCCTPSCLLATRWTFRCMGEENDRGCRIGCESERSLCTLQEIGENEEKNEIPLKSQVSGTLGLMMHRKKWNSTKYWIST